MLVSCHLVAQQQDNNGPAECRIVGGKDVVVHVGSKAVTLNDGQVVIVLGVSNGNATVKLQLQDGSVGIVQVPASCISKMERAPESTPLKTTQNTNIKGPGLPDLKVQHLRVPTAPLPQHFLHLQYPSKSPPLWRRSKRPP